MKINALSGDLQHFIYAVYCVCKHTMNCLVKKKIKNKLFFKLEILMKKSGAWSALLLNIYAEI